MRQPGIIRKQKIINNYQENQQLFSQINQQQEQDIIEIDISNKELIVMPNSIFNNNDTYCSQFIIMNVRKNNIEQFPLRIQKWFSNVKQLNFSENRLSKISLNNFTNLQLLILDHNNLTKLAVQDCQNLIILSAECNKIDYITLPSKLQILNLKTNNLQNLYFMSLLSKNNIKSVDVSNNQLYQIKITVLIQKLTVFTLDDNHIQFFQGFQYLPNLTTLSLKQNSISFDRYIINQLLKLKYLEHLELSDNPLENSGYQIQSFHALIKKFTFMMTFNSEPINKDQNIKQSPYKLYIQSEPKYKIKQWNFTLGECEDQPYNEVAIDLMCDNDINKDQSLKKTFKINNYYKPVNYQAYLNKLLLLSYVPSKPIRKSQVNKFISRRLQQSEEQYKIINEMMESRGGIVYLKKITCWAFNNYGHSDNKEKLLFVGEEINQKQFQSFSKVQFKKQINANTLGNQPYMFSCYQIIIRYGNQPKEFGCMYLIQTEHL